MTNKSIGKRLVSKVLVPATKKYLLKDRDVRFIGMDLHVPSGVFHPSLFFSTKTMCQVLSTIQIGNKNICEIGCGSGAISIKAAQLGGTVTCGDVNPLAVVTASKNAERNQVNITVVKSDLFENIPAIKFDIILTNPPFYPKDPVNMEERAWYAGKNHDFFYQFFHQSSQFLNSGGTIYMVLSHECNLKLIDKIAGQHSFQGNVIHVRRNLLEKSFVLAYTIHQ